MTFGELGNGSFWYDCAGPTDAACPDGFRARTFPTAIAVGASFGLAYGPSNGVGRSAVIDVSAPDLISSQSGAFRLVSPGFVSVLARRSGRVVDLLHLDGQLVDRAAIVRGGIALNAVELELGESVTLGAEPQSALGRTLAGSLPYAWSVADASVARLASVADDNRVLLEAEALGETEVRVVVGDGIEATVSISVVEPPEPEGPFRDSSAEPTSSGTAADTDTDTDGDTDTDLGSTGSSTDTDGGTDTHGTTTGGGR